MTSLRNIEPKFVVKLQPFGTERDMYIDINFLLPFFARLLCSQTEHAHKRLSIPHADVTLLQKQQQQADKLVWRSRPLHARGKRVWSITYTLSVQRPGIWA